VSLRRCGGIGQVGPEGEHLVGVAGAPDAQVHTPFTQDVKRRQAHRRMQRVVHGGEHDGNTQAHVRGALAERSQGDVRGAGMGPFGAEVVFNEPHALQADLLGVFHLFDHFPITLRLARGRPRTRDLDLIKESKAHRNFFSRLEGRRLCHIPVPHTDGCGAPFSAMVIDRPRHARRNPRLNGPRILRTALR
jgi:hypothetical protein